MCVVNELCQLYVTHFILQIFTAACILSIKLENYHLQINFYKLVIYLI